MSRSYLPLVAVVALAGCGSPAPPPQAGGLGPALSAGAAPVVAADTERVENPRYARWAKHKVGTTVTVLEKSVAPMLATETTSVYKLKSVTDDRVVVEVSGEIKAPDGTKHPTSPQLFEYPRLTPVPKERAKANLSEPEGTTAEREETVSVLGREYKVKWYKSKGRVEAGETRTETWVSDDVPVGVVKSVHTIPSMNKTITAEVVGLTAE